MILSRFFKPKWQHPDPQVRKLAVQSLSASDPALAQVAREDQNPSVRLAALYRIKDLNLLQQIAREDPETNVRDTANTYFRKLMAGEEPDSPDLETRLTILQQGQLPGLAGFLATHGAEPRLRLAALAYLEDESVLADIATKDSAAEVRFAALGRVHEAVKLEFIVKQTRNRDKRVNRGARERLDACRVANQQKAHSEQLCARMEALAGAEPTRTNAGRFRTLEREWDEQRHVAGADLLERFEQAKILFLTRLQESEAQRSARSKLHETLEQLQRKLQTESELTPVLATEIQESLLTIQSDWESLGTAETTEELQFTEIVQTIKDYQRLLHRNRERAERLREVLKDADELLKQASEVRQKDLMNLQKYWGGLERPEAQDLTANLQLQFDAVLDRLRTRLRRQAEQRDQELNELNGLIEDLEEALSEGSLQQAISLRDRARECLQQNISLSRKEMVALEKRMHASAPRINELRGWRRWGTGQAREHLCEEAESLIELEDNPLSIAQRIKQLRITWKSLDGLEGAASKTLWDRFNTACERAYEPCQVFFDAQAQERQANLEKKEVICSRLETLAATTDWDNVDWRATDRIWREAQNQWRKIGPVSRSARRSIERRFSKILRHLDTYLDKERQRDVQRRKALISQVQELAESDDLRAAVNGAKKAQAEWHPTVLASRREEQALWKQFRGACDSVFERRQSEQQAAEAERQANLVRKTALCEEIEALLTSDDDQALAQARTKIRAAEQEWTSIGPVPKTALKEIEQRFETIQKRLEQSLRERQRAQEREVLQNLRDKAQLCARIEALLVQEEADDFTDLLIQAQQAWETLPSLKQPLETLIWQRFDTACKAVTQGGEARQALLRTLQENLEEKKILCLRMDIATGVETPPDFAQARMEYQVSRLSESLTTRDTGSSEQKSLQEVQQIQQEWYLTGILPSELNDTLEERFNRALAAFYDDQAQIG